MRYWLICLLMLASCGQSSDEGRPFKSVSREYNLRAKSFLDKQPDSVLYYADLSIEASELSGDERHVRQSYFYRAYTLRKQGDLKGAMEAIRSGLEHPVYSESVEEDLPLLKGKLYTDIGQYDNALELFFACADRFRHEGNNVGVGKCMNLIAFLYYRIGDYPKANQYNIKAEEIWQEVDYPLGKGATQTLWSYLAVQNEDYVGAHRHINKAQGIYDEIGDDQRVCNSYLNRGFIYMSQQDWDRAEMQFTLAQDMSGELNFIQLEIDALNKLGECYTRQREFDLARTSLTQGLSMAEELGDKALLAEFYKNLSEFALESGDFEHAVGFMKSFQQTKDEIFNRQRALGLSQSEVAYETEKLKEENRSLAEATSRRNTLFLFLGIVAALIITVALLLINRSKIRIRMLEQRKALDEQVIKENQAEKKRLEAESKLKEEENARLQLEVEKAEAELSNVTMQIFQKNESLAHLLKEVEVMEQSGSGKAELLKLKRSIKKNLNLDEDWARFKVHFDQVHKGFLNRLAENYPALTAQDLRHCAYIKMNLGTKEIASLLNINPTSVQRSRVRLKKKLVLRQEDDLIREIQSM